MKSLGLYLKHQSHYFIFLISVFVIPFFLFFQFSPYKEPKASYVVLGALFFSQFMFFKEKVFRKKQEKRIAEILHKEKGQVPSRKEIIRRTDLVLKQRGFTILLVATSVFALMIYYRAF